MLVSAYYRAGLTPFMVPYVKEIFVQKLEKIKYYTTKKCNFITKAI